MAKFISAEQEFDTDVVTIITDNGNIFVTETVLKNFIASKGYNVDKCSTGLTCDPYATEYDKESISLKDYLDNNFDAVCEMYFHSLNS